MSFQNKRCVFTKFAQGQVDESYFAVENFESNEEPQEGQVLIQLTFISVDPYMRGRMNSTKNYFDTFQPNQPFTGGCTGKVLKSNDKNFQEGDVVSGFLPWVLYQVVNTKGLIKLPADIRTSYFLGMLGMPGQSALLSLQNIGNVKAGQTVFISGAAGAVGATAGQICKSLGCKVVGSVGSDDKAQYIKSIGFDAAINYKTENLAEKLQEYAPEGYDLYFDNVGGYTLDVALEKMKNFGTVIGCGSIANYDTKPEDRYGNKNLFYVVTKSLKFQGFIVSNWYDQFPKAHVELLQLYKDGKLQVQETVVKGFENISTAFLGLFKGDNTGKMIVEL